jgi:Tol biopolymer transport system component
MADVYLADDLGLRRKVVLKIMLPHLAQDEAFVTRFQREARTTARLNHPNIIQVYSTGLTPDGRPYLAMQYIRGGTLHEKLTRLAAQGELLPAQTALTIMRQIADALNFAHGAGIVHRDLKPSNILLHSNGVPVLTDLGIAAVESTTRLTRTGEVMGTPFYMSPEQAQGKALDGRSDIYSMGVILYETLAGNPPFQATSPLAVLHQHIYEPPPLLLSSREDLSPITSQVVEICLRKDPDQRYQNAGELVTALDGALAAETAVPTPASTASLAATILEPQPYHYPPPAPLQPPQPEPTRNRRWLWLVPLLLILCLALFIGGQWLWRGTVGQPTTPTVEVVILPVPTDVIEEPAATSEPPAATIEQPVATIEEPTATIEEAAPLVPATVTPTPLPPPPPRRNQIVFQSNRDGDHEIYIMEQDGSSQRKLTSNTFADNYPVVSPDGRQILFQSERDGNKEVYVMNLDGGDQRRLTNSATADRLPTWSPDGTQIAFVSERSGNRNLHIMDADGGNERQVTFDDLWTGHPSWSVNNQLAFNGGEVAGSTWEIYVVDIDGGNRRQLTSNSVSDWAPEWSPDGRRILYNSSISKTDEAALFVMNADGSNPHLVFTSDDYEWGADWTPDGDSIVFTREQGDYSYIYMMDADGGNVTYISERGSYPSWVR